MQKGISGGRNKNFDIERTKTFEYILEIIDAQKRIAGQAQLIVSVTDLDPEKMKKAAAAESWNMIEKGVRHLMDGGPAGTPGVFNASVSKMSLRSSPLAQSLGIKRLPFEDENIVALYHDGFTAAFTPVKRLLEAAIHDARDGKRLIAEAIEKSDSTKLGFFLMPEERIGVISRERMNEMLKALEKPASPAEVFNAMNNKKTEPTEEQALLKKHQNMTLDYLAQEYQNACHLLHDRLHAIKGPQPTMPKSPLAP